jgi:hypothetical protein
LLVKAIIVPSGENRGKRVARHVRSQPDRVRAVLVRDPDVAVVAEGELAVGETWGWRANLIGSAAAGSASARATIEAQTRRASADFDMRAP